MTSGGDVAAVGAQERAWAGEGFMRVFTVQTINGNEVTITAYRGELGESVHLDRGWIEDEEWRKHDALDVVQTLSQAVVWVWPDTAEELGENPPGDG